MTRPPKIAGTTVHTAREKTVALLHASGDLHGAEDAVRKALERKQDAGDRHGEDDHACDASQCEVEPEDCGAKSFHGWTSIDLDPL